MAEHRKPARYDARQGAGYRRHRARRGLLPARLVAGVQGTLEFRVTTPTATDSANPSLLIGADLADPISGSLPHRSYLCRVRPAEPS